MKKLIAGFVMIRVALGGYIDPNTGGMIFQALAGMFAVISGAVLVFAGQIKAFFTGRRRRREDADDHIEMMEENNQ